MTSQTSIRRLFSAALLLLLCTGIGLPYAEAQGDQAKLEVVETTTDADIVRVTVVAPPALRGIDPPPDSFTIELPSGTMTPEIEHVGGDDLDVVLLVDISASMTPEAMIAAKRSGAAFVTQLPTDTRVAVISFGDVATIVQPFTTEVVDIVAALHSLEPAGNTALHAAVVTAAQQFDPTSDAVRSIVLLSDGGNTVEDTTLGQAQAALQSSGATLHAISIETDETNATELQALADVTQGTVSRVEQLESIQTLHQSIADDLRNYYRLEFRLTSPGDQLAIVRASLGGQTLATATLVVSGPVALVADQPVHEVAAPAPAPTSTIAPSASTPHVVSTEAAPDANALKWGSIAAVAIALAVIGLVLLVPGDRTLQRLKPAAQFTNALKQRTSTGIRAVPGRMADLVDGRLSKRRSRSRVSILLDTAGWKIRTSEFVVVVGVSVFIGFLAGLTQSLVTAVMFALLVLSLFGLTLFIKVARRRKAFASQLTGTLQMLSGSLRTGYSLPQAISFIAKEGEAPTSEEFSRIAMEIRLGRDLVESVQATATRMANVDLEWTTGAIDIARQVGGNLAEILDNVGETIRTRERIRRQVKSLSAEGRISAWILVALPFPMFIWQFMVNRDYTMLLFRDPIGQLILTIGVSLLVIGMFWLRHQVQIDY